MQIKQLVKIILLSTVLTFPSYGSELSADEYSLNYISYVMGSDHLEQFSSQKPSAIASGINNILNGGVTQDGLTDVVTKSLLGINPLNPAEVSNGPAFLLKLTFLFLLGMPHEQTYKQNELKATHFGKYYFTEDAKNPLEAKKLMFDTLDKVSTDNFPYPYTDKKIVLDDPDGNKIIYSFIYEGKTLETVLTLGNVHYSSMQAVRDSLLGYTPYYESQSDISLKFEVRKPREFRNKVFYEQLPLKEVKKMKDFDKYFLSLSAIKGVLIGTNDLNDFYHNQRHFTQDNLKEISSAIIKKQVVAESK